jgi:hypothetical protein
LCIIGCFSTLISSKLYSFSPSLTPINFDQLIANTATRAPIQDYYYNLRRHITNICPIVKNKENKKNDSDNIQYQINELKEMMNIFKNTVDELKTMVMDTISKKTETIYVPKLIGDKDIITGIIYLIQPEELLQTNRYKIGCSTKNDLSRVNSYKKNSRYLYIAECINPYTLEANIKSAFNDKYKLIAGKEYFEGDEKDIINDFVKIVNDYNNKIYCSDNILDNAIKDNN